MNAFTNAVADWSFDEWAWATAVFVLTFFGSLAIVGFLLVIIPPTFFQDSHSRDFWTDRHPVLRWGAKIAKNVLGILLVIFGLLLSFPGIPGQGLLTILIGLALVDFPGKRRLERAILGRPRVLGTVNRLRARFRRPPLIAPCTLVWLLWTACVHGLSPHFLSSGTIDVFTPHIFGNV